MSHPSDGSMDEVTIPSDPLVSQILDRRYRLESLLGQGGMGSVYRAVDMRLDRPVAVKILRGSEGTDEARFASEVRTLARFAHAHLVRLFDAGEMQSRAFLVMELIEGPNLAKRMSAGQLSSDETARIGFCVASALAYVHAQGIVHRDVKPANILLDQRGDAHLTDFGIAQLVDTTGMTATGMTLGTPAYLAPEQAQGAKVGPPADIYALGLVMLECITGHRAFEGTASEVAAARILRAPVIPPDVDYRWRQIIRQMTLLRPSDRIEADGVVKALADFTRATELPIVGAHNLSIDDATVPMGYNAMDDTVVVEPTAVALAPIKGIQSSQTDGSSRRRRFVAGLAALGLVGLFAGLASAGVFSGSPPKRGALLPPRTTTTTTTAPTTTTTSTTTTSTTTTTTTTVPTSSVANAANGVLSVVNAGVATGDIAPNVGNQLTQQLQPLVGPVASPATPQEIQAFDQFVTLVNQGVASGSITGDSTVSALSTTTSSLAAALGATVPTSTTLPATNTGNTGSTGNTGVGPGNGHGHGH